jgi:hypothetical protein
MARDVDSTLHPYWDLFRSIVHERFGVDMVYEEQTDWAITRIPNEFLRASRLGPHLIRLQESMR